MVTKKFLLSALEWNRDRLPDITPQDAINLMVGCAQLMGGRLGPWLDRRGRRATLRNRRLTATKVRLLRDLITLTISDLEAVNWIDDWPLGALPVKSEPAPPTAAQIEQRRAAAAKGLAARLAEKERIERLLRGPGEDPEN